MNRLFAFLLFPLVFSCNSDKPSSQHTIASSETIGLEIGMAVNTTEDLVINSEPYEISFEMTKLENNVYDFEISMKLNNGSFYVSPNSKRGFTGIFTVLFDDNKQLEVIADLIETPRSVEEFDPHPYVNGNVNWVRENTRYNQKLQRTSENDFQVKGLIQFVIEPRCTLEKIPFIIKYEDGKMRVELFGC